MLTGSILLVCVRPLCGVYFISRDNPQAAWWVAALPVVLFVILGLYYGGAILLLVHWNQLYELSCGDYALFSTLGMCAYTAMFVGFTIKEAHRMSTFRQQLDAPHRESII